MNKVQSALLTQFYRELQAWIDAGTPHDGPFSIFSGICNNLWMFARLHSDTISDNRAEELELELQEQFALAGLATDYPFNIDGDDYSCEADNRSRWKNPDRLEWVLKHAKL